MGVVWGGRPIRRNFAMIFWKSRPAIRQLMGPDFRDLLAAKDVNFLPISPHSGRGAEMASEKEITGRD